MGRVRRPRMSAREKVELWKRWKRGESLSDIGRALGRIPGAVHHVVSARGGIPPPSRTRSRRSLTLTEREEISRGLARGYSVRQIGVRLSRAPSTISREVRRNGGRRQYRASVAALVHDSKLTVNDPNPEASHRPILYDSGRPSSVIWFRTLHASTDSATRPPRDRARSRSPIIDLYRKHAFSTRAWRG